MSVKQNLLNQKFGKLLVISEAEYIKNTRVKWLCQCECDNFKIVTTRELKKGDTKSCGCLHKQSSILNVQKAIKKRTKHSPMITSARRVWRDSYNDGISFDDFFLLSQKKCFYCNSLPANQTNYFNEKINSKQSYKNGLFIYNGLDRLDSTKSHNIDNVVTCCFICNRAKRERSLNEFIAYIDNLITNRISPDVYNQQSKLIVITNLKEQNKYAYNSSIKSKFCSGYNDGDLSIETFYQLSQLNCYYCGQRPSNKHNKINKKSSEFAKLTGLFIYNGLDRLDCTLPHNYNNVVPSCKYCNYAKRNLTISKFDLWIDRLKNKKAEFSLGF